MLLVDAAGWTVDQVEAIVAQLKASGSWLACDLEGQKLGQLDGRISTLSVAPVTATSVQQVTTFDLASLTSTPGMQNAVSSIMGLMADSSVVKVMYDCRMDGSALLHELGCPLGGVFDLQLLEMLSRRDFGETVQKQRGRLLCFFHRDRKLLYGQHNMFTHVHSLSGLGQCLAEFAKAYMPGGLPQELKEHLGRKKVTRQLEEWMVRPLPGQLLTYASMDVLAIALLYRLMDGQRLVNRHQATVLAASSRYARFYEHGPPPDKGLNKYLQHPLLPLGVLESFGPPGLTAASTASQHSGGILTCTGCQRTLNVQAFTRGERKLATRKCYVCAVIALHHSK